MVRQGAKTVVMLRPRVSTELYSSLNCRSSVHSAYFAQRKMRNHATVIALRTLSLSMS
jgi:hypothetical protein